jgi:hypothetical protein
MKKASLFILIFIIAASWLNAQTGGTLTVTVTTNEAGGNYAPRNIVAIWVEDNQGNFVKTLMAYAQTRKTHLNTWEASTTAAGSPFNTVDAISGATRSSHATRTCTWNGTDINANVVPDGTYRLRMELTDKNNTGNFSTFTFTKGLTPENQAPGNVPSFTSISINWEPLITSVQDPSLEKEYQVFPNPTTGIITITGNNIQDIKVINQAGTMVSEGLNSALDLSGQPDGVYYVKISSDKGIITKKILKKQK